MRIDRENFRAALFTATLAGAAGACGGEPPPAPAAAQPTETTGAEEPVQAAAEPVSTEPEPAAEPAPEPVPEVQQVSPTVE